MNNVELSRRVIEVFKKYSSALSVYRIFALDQNTFLVLAGPGKDVESDFNSNYYGVNLKNGITMCIPDAPYNPKFKGLFDHLKERVIF